MKKYLGTAIAFTLGLVSIFAFKTPENSKLKDTRTRWSYNNKSHIPVNCVVVTCTITNTGITCSVGDVIYSNSTCIIIEIIYIYQP